MKDDLHDLLRRADASAPPPATHALDLPARIRRRARNHRRLAACGFAMFALLLSLVPLLSLRHPVSPPRNTAVIAVDVDAEVHLRTAILLERFESRRKATSIDSSALSDRVQMHRNRAALVLLRSANRQLPDDPGAGAELLKRTIALFPDTPAALSAGRQLE